MAELEGLIGQLDDALDKAAISSRPTASQATRRYAAHHPHQAGLVEPRNPGAARRDPRSDVTVRVDKLKATRFANIAVFLAG